MAPLRMPSVFFRRPSRRRPLHTDALCSPLRARLRYQRRSLGSHPGEIELSSALKQTRHAFLRPGRRRYRWCYASGLPPTRSAEKLRRCTPSEDS